MYQNLLFLNTNIVLFINLELILILLVNLLTSPVNFKSTNSISLYKGLLKMTKEYWEEGKTPAIETLGWNMRQIFETHLLYHTLIFLFCWMHKKNGIHVPQLQFWFGPWELRVFLVSDPFQVFKQKKLA